MSQTQKTLVSLLITLLLFAGFCCFAFLGGFEYIEVKFYAPRMVRNKGETLEKIGQMPCLKNLRLMPFCRRMQAT